MKTYLELEGKLGPKLKPQSDQSRPIHPDTNPCMRKETKATEKRKKLIPTKKYKVKVAARPKSKTSNTTTLPPVVTTSNAPTNSESQKSSQEGTSESNPLPLKNIPTHADTPWPKAGKMSGHIFKLRKDCPIPPTPTTITTSKPPIKLEPQTGEQVTPGATAAPKAEKCGCGPNWPICKNMDGWKTGMVTTKSNFSRAIVLCPSAWL